MEIMSAMYAKLGSAGAYRFALPSPNLRAMSASIPCLAELPLEILEQILMSLSGQDIVKIDAVRRVTTNSARLRSDFTAARSR